MQQNYFLGIFPDERIMQDITQYLQEVRSLLGEVGDIRWVDPEKLHVTLMYLGHSLSFFDRNTVANWLKSVQTNQNPMLKLGYVKLGFPRSDPNILYFSLDEGGNFLRAILRSIKSRRIKNFRKKVFIPHMTIARFKNDLSVETQQNIRFSLNKFNEKFEPISFNGSNISLVRSDLKNYEILESFEIS